MGEQTGDDGGPTFSPAPIRVNVDGLKDFRSWLGRELDGNLRPGADSILNDHSMGVRFGIRNAGPQVQKARQAYANSLATSTANLTAYINASEILIAAIQEVVTNYRAADLSAAGSSQTLDSILTGVITQQEGARYALDHRADASEQHRMHPDATA